jgi:hypothetical protein
LRQDRAAEAAEAFAASADDAGSGYSVLARLRFNKRFLQNIFGIFPVFTIPDTNH